MTLEELKAFEASHPQYAPLFPLIMKEFDATVKEEMGKAFAAINEKMKKRAVETSQAHNVPEEDIKVVSEAFTAFLKQVNADYVNKTQKQFAMIVK